jgi:hypothetical protein
MLAATIDNAVANTRMADDSRLSYSAKRRLETPSVIKRRQEIAMSFILVLAAALSSQPSSQPYSLAKETVQSLDARNARDSGLPGGGAYEATVVGKLLEDAGVMRKCELKVGPKPPAFSFYLDIAANGSVKAIRFIPDTPMAPCIRRSIPGVKLPPFKGGFLVKLMVSTQ